MPKYVVILERQTVEVTDITIEAISKEQAEEIAIDMARFDYEYNFDWEQTGLYEPRALRVIELKECDND